MWIAKSGWEQTTRVYFLQPYRWRLSLISIQIPDHSITLHHISIIQQITRKGETCQLWVQPMEFLNLSCFWSNSGVGRVQWDSDWFLEFWLIFFWVLGYIWNILVGLDWLWVFELVSEFGLVFRSWASFQILDWFSKFGLFIYLEISSNEQ